MNTNFFKKIRSFVYMMVLLAMLAFVLPQPVMAASNQAIDIVSVKADESVTIRGSDFPANRTWTVRMDKAGNLGLNGIVVAESKIEKGGSFEATYRIPAELKGAKTIAIRMESTTGGYFVYDWFNNVSGTTQPTATPTSQPGVPVTGPKPSIRFLAVKANDSVVVEASDFPANTRIKVRVGPFKTFFRDFVVVDYVNSGATSPFKFTIKLPEVVKGVDMVTVRLDTDGGNYAYNAFKNVDSGTISPTATPTAQPTSGSCEILSVTPSRVTTRADFDAVWTVKNTSGKDWLASSVDYKYISGAKLYKRAAAYDLPQTVKAGETVKIVVDMLGPDQTGSYSTNWALVSGSTTLCNLPMTLTVR